MDGNKKSTKLSEDEILDALAELLVDDFLAMEAAGTLPKPKKRAK